MKNQVRMMLVLLLTLALLAGCQPTAKRASQQAESNPYIRYATGFDLSDSLITIREPWPGAQQPQAFALTTPPARVVVTATTHLPFLELLEVAHTLVGFPNTGYIYSPAIRQRVADGLITDLGAEGHLNLELLFELEPDLVIAFDMGGESSYLDKVIHAGIPVLYNSDFLETSILGRAEWIKVFGALFDRQEKADLIFRAVEDAYQTYRSIAGQARDRPTVFSGIQYGDTWFLPGGQNWSAQLIRDAGGTYLWADDESHGWLELGFESVFDKAGEADYWIGTATLTSLAELAGQDERYTEFEAYKQGHVYNYSRRRSPGGGFDYFESAYARPDRVLADLIAILHPELMPRHRLYYFEALE